VSDINYLIKGLTLYESLKEHDNDIVLHYLCIDNLSYEKLKEYESESLIAYNVNDLLENDKQLKLVKEQNYKYFCWSLASYFTNYLIKKNIGDITYIDSDIYFHESIRVILNAIGDKEVGIFRHRQFKLTENRPEGRFNVGVVHFKNRKIGAHILNWWADAVLYSKYPHLATCGDQRYLDEFQNMCPDDYIFIDGDIGHGAPWQWQLYDFSDYEKNGNISWEDKKQKLIFTHFSQFDFRHDGYTPSLQHHVYTPLHNYNEISGLKIIYDEYFNKLLNTKNKYDVKK
jgi:hypothetical protein